jgi:hypothetical protein
MAGLTQRKTVAVTTNGTNTTTAVSSSKETQSQMSSTQQHEHEQVSTTSSNNNVPVSTFINGSSKGSNNGTNGTNGTNGGTTGAGAGAGVPTAANSKGKSLKERSQIPYSFYITFSTILSLQYCSGLYTYSAIQSWYNSLSQSTYTMIDLLSYSRNVFLSLPGLSSIITTSDSTNDSSGPITQMEYIFVITIWTVVILPLFYVFFIAPFRAGFWTGRKSKRHVFHRYMGLCYLIHYVLAWIEFFTNPSSSKTSYLCHIIAVMGNVYSRTSYCSFFQIHFPFLNVTQICDLFLFFPQVYYKVHRHTFHSRYYPN